MISPRRRPMALPDPHPGPSSAQEQPQDACAAQESADDLAVRRLIDANLDRAREGLRVLEDWARFALERADLVSRTKDMRQTLGRLHRDAYKLARHTASDSGAGLGHPAQAERRQPAQVVAANAARVQEALRVLEEFGRSSDPPLAAAAAAIRYGLYDLEVALLQGSRDGARRRQLLARCHLYLVTSPMPELEAMVAAALDGGVRLVQYRAKPGSPGPDGAPLSDGQRLEQARALRRLCSDHGALFLVNDRIDLALAVDADGVHLGQDDLPPAVARRLLGEGRLIGRSTHALPQLQQALRDGCDYVGVGPVQATPTKPGRAPVGLEYVRQAAAACPIPFFAIGGLGLETIPQLQRVGAERIAVVRAITEAADPAAASRALLTGLGRPS
nr:thiamine phosphate synthase [Cyanobium sp. LEGE 06113]